MTSVNVNFYDAVNQGADAHQTDGQCFDGYGAQAALDIAILPTAFPATAQATVGSGVRYLGIEADGKFRIYAGPDATDAVKEARAVRASGFITVSVKPGQKIHVWAPA